MGMLIEVGQVLWLRGRFNNEGDISDVIHPYLVLRVIGDTALEIGQMDSVTPDKVWKLALESNKAVFNEKPTETVIEKDGFIQMDNAIQIEYYDGLTKYLRTADKLSKGKLDEILQEYRDYHITHEIDENKQIYMTKEELESLN